MGSVGRSIEQQMTLRKEINREEKSLLLASRSEVICNALIPLTFAFFCLSFHFSFFCPLWYFFLLVLCFLSLILSESPSSIAKFGYGIGSSYLPTAS